MLAAGLLVVAGCGDDEGGEAIDEVGEGEGAVSIIAWAGYIESGETDPAYDWVTAFEEETGCEVTVKVAATSDEMVSLMTGSDEYDLVTASGDASLRLISGGTVQEVNTDLIPSYDAVDERLQRCTVAHGRRHPLRHALPVGRQRADVQHRGLPGGADHLGRHLRGAGPARRRVQRRPRAGLRRTDLHRRRRPLPAGDATRPRHRGSLRPEPGAVRRRRRLADPAERD